MAEERLLFTKQEWDAAVPDVVRQMQHYVAPFCTSISRHLGDYGKLEGTGTYLDLAGRTFILSNQHVARARNETQVLIHQLADRDELPLIIGNHLGIEGPLDIALLPVSADVLSAGDHKSRAVSQNMILPRHMPAPTELLMFTGFAGARSSFHFGTLITPASTSASREVDLPGGDERFDPRYHFGLDYRPDLATSIDGTSTLPVPPGLSGSAVWNTRFVECRIAGIPWTPECALITGLIWGWPSDVGCLVATRAEFLSEVLADAAAKIASGELDAPSM